MGSTTTTEEYGSRIRRGRIAGTDLSAGLNNKMNGFGFMERCKPAGRVFVGGGVIVKHSDTTRHQT